MEKVENIIREALIAIGENPDREGLVGTPDRIRRMWQEIFRGYDPKQKPKITLCVPYSSVLMYASTSLPIKSLTSSHFPMLVCLLEQCCLYF